MIKDNIKWQPKWTIEKYDKDMKLYETEEIDGNLLLNEGIGELLNLLIGGTATAFSNAKREFTVANSNSDTGKNLNRKVESALRTKVSPDTWVIRLQITIS